MSFEVITSDALEALRRMPSESVQAIVTSPPYWALRDYGAEGQIGLEADPIKHVLALHAVFKEARRVLHRTGTLWVNYGDCWAGGGRGGDTGKSTLASGGSWSDHSKFKSAPAKSQGLGPYRPGQLIESSSLLIRQLSELAKDRWIFRSRIVWAKGASCNPNWVGNPMPESVAGWFDRVDALTGEVKAVKQGFRPAQAHEYVLLFAKGPQSYGDSEAVKEASSPKTNARGHGVNPKSRGKSTGQDRQNESWSGSVNERVGDRNLRSVWAINPKPFPEAHFATYPQELAELCIKAATPAGGCCRICGAPTVRVQLLGELNEEHARACGRPDGTDRTPPTGWDKRSVKNRGHHKLGRYTEAGAQEPMDVKGRILDGLRHKQTIGWRMSCTCWGALTPGEPVHPAAFAQQTRPAVVLDPFAGSGTTMRAAEQLGRDSVGIEINPEFAAMARRLTEAFVSRGVQQTLFEECA